MKEKVDLVKSEVLDKLNNVKDLKELDELRVEYLSKKGKISELSSLMGSIPNEEKKEFGMVLNALKNEVNEKFEELKNRFELEELNKSKQ